MADTWTEPPQPGVGHSCVHVPLPISLEFGNYVCVTQTIFTDHQSTAGFSTRMKTASNTRSISDKKTQFSFLAAIWTFHHEIWPMDHEWNFAISIKMYSHLHLCSLHPSIPFLGQRPAQRKHVLLVQWNLLIALIKNNLIAPWREFSSSAFTLYEFFNHLSSSRHAAKIESFHQQTHQHGAPHIHHPLEFLEGVSTVQPDPSANSLLPRKLEHTVD